MKNLAISFVQTVIFCICVIIMGFVVVMGMTSIGKLITLLTPLYCGIVVSVGCFIAVWAAAYDEQVKPSQYDVNFL